jgi:hypothetical protein
MAHGKYDLSILYASYVLLKVYLQLTLQGLQLQGGSVQTLYFQDHRTVLP